MNSILNINSGQTSLHLSSEQASKTNNQNSTNVKITPSINEIPITKDWPEDKISISEEAKKELESHNKENVDASDTSQSKSILELAAEIKQKTNGDLKNRIEELTQELKRLEAENDESSKEQAKLIQGQINALNGHLLTIMTTE